MIEPESFKVDFPALRGMTIIAVYIEFTPMRGLGENRAAPEKEQDH
jgi:hypothetical protein